MANINKDNKLEKIYTPDNLTNHMLDLLDKYYDGEVTEFLEPAAGSGNMIDVIQSRNRPILSYDIFNETGREDIIEEDFLKTKLTYKPGRVTIMNPPFAKGLKFMYKCLSVSDIVISILSIGSWVNFDYYKYPNLELIEIGNKTEFSNGGKYDICIMVVRRNNEV